LVLIGPGIHPQRPNKLSAKISLTVTITGSTANGFALMGLDIPILIIGDNNTSVDNVVISECKISNAYFFCNNILFENNIVSYSGCGGSCVNFYGTTQRIIQNNIFDNNVGFKDGDAIIRNNIFASNDQGRKSFSSLSSVFATNAVQIHNNIFYKNSPSGIASDGIGGTFNFLANAEYKNNIAYLTTDGFPANSSSSGNLITNPLFENYPALGAAFSFEYDYRLQPVSPGINYGIDGKDVGMWGGIAPVNAGFEPPIPRIYQLSVSNATVPPGGTIQLTIKATKAQ